MNVYIVTMELAEQNKNMIVVGVCMLSDVDSDHQRLEKKFSSAWESELHNEKMLSYAHGQFFPPAVINHTIEYSFGFCDLVHITTHIFNQFI